MLQSTEAVERAKYEALWAGKGYRSGRSPGAAVAHGVLKALRPSPGDTIVDYGAGPGKACAIFLDAGLKPTAVDIAENSLEPELRDSIRFVRANLWDLPSLRSDWCYCTDVLEHLPEDKVDEAVAGIAARTLRGGYIQVATVYDTNGPTLAGEHLHLTVKPSGWWAELVGRHFRTVRPLTRLHLPMRHWQYGMLVGT